MQGTDSPDPAPDGRPALAACDIIIAMRFSFFGLSGWQSDFSREKALLFDPARLEVRLDLLEQVALASLAAQTDRQFHLFVLTSDDLPVWAMSRLQAACSTALGEGRFTIAARPPGRARRFLRHFLNARFGTGAVVQVVLDDDDGLACDFIEILRGHLARLDDAPPELPYFLSFVNGYGLVFEEEPGADIAVYRHRYPYINLGLTMISTVNGENLFSIDHKAAPRKFGCQLVRDAPMFVRSVHGLNDSRVSVTDRWTPLPGWRSDADIGARFAWLTKL